MNLSEFEIIGSSNSDVWMRQCIGLFIGNMTFDEKYQECVENSLNNSKRIKIANLLKEIRNGVKSNGK